eukprot:TRINITY_DN6999_c0_g3_i2.p1 TRINITY_DN6999_c0_g3~~TRINITY_DN6999_c0_g3_i2.p1  ORF type:complete len:788 (-),score=139.69 TRINITY_DN6999_c0_g3_i2:465-2828(-)
MEVPHPTTEDLIRSARLLGKVVKGVPQNFQFSPDGSRLYFIGTSDPRTNMSSLYYVDTSSERSTGDWFPVIDAEEMDHGGEMSKEEELRRERQRTVGFGITSYVFHEDSQRFLVPSAGSFYVIDVGNPEVVPVAVEVKGSGTRMDPTWSPNARFIAFVRDSNLFLTAADGSSEVQLTASASKHVTCGVADFIMQEEFDRYTGYWWSPTVSPSSRLGVPAMRILYEEVDSTGVSTYSVPEHDLDGTTDPSPYPRPGGQNTTSRLKLVEIDADTGALLASKTLCHPHREYGFEYLVRAGWFPNGERVWAQFLDRKQQQLQLVSFALSDFTDDVALPLAAPAHEPLGRVLREETSDRWVNVTDLLEFVDDGQLLWCSEATDNGMRHIFRVTPGETLSSGQSVAVTCGDWQVDPEFLTVDPHRQLVYFMANKETPLESHLYVASYAAGADPTEVYRLTQSGSSHTVQVLVSELTDKTLFVTSSSNVHSLPQVNVFSVSYAAAAGPAFKFSEPSVARLAPVAVKPANVSTPFAIRPPELVSFTNKLGLTIHGAVYKPADFDPNKRYPTILYVYGGPHVQLVVNRYESLIVRFAKFFMWNSMGYAVAVFDGVGSYRRGLHFEGHLRNSMGTVEISDQVEGINYLVAQGIVDPARVAITGWSYGGYLSLMAIAQRPDVFKLSIVGAPVTLWEAYDTGYTERYMDTPDNNPEGYRRGSVLSYVAGFPDSENRLMLIHGLKDENVHFYHTGRLIEALIVAQKPYSLCVFPKERHGVRDDSSAVYLELRTLAFLKNL